MRQLQVRLVKSLRTRMKSRKSEHQQNIYVTYLTIFVLLYNLEFLYQDQVLNMVRNLLKNFFSRVLTFPSKPNKPTPRALQL